MRKLSWLLVLIAASLLSMMPINVARAAMSTGEQRKILFIVESHGLGGDSITWKSSEDVFARQISPQATLGTGGITQTTFINSSTAENVLGLAVIPDGYVQSVASYLKSNNFIFGRMDWFYNYTDQGDQNTNKEAYFSLFIYPDGRVRDSGVTIVSSAPRVLYYKYDPKNIAAGLPSGWSYSDGGILYKYVLDQNLNIISETQVNTGGAYDPPLPPTNGSSYDPNAGLELLIAQVAVPEMQNYSALYSLIDYANTIAPAYQCDSNGNCVATTSINSTSRSYNKSDMCTGPNDPLGAPSYVNTGSVGYTLQYTVSRYFVQPDGNYTKTATSTGYTVSPTVNFNVSATNVSLPNNNYIIDPWGTGVLYDFTNDTVNKQPCNRYLYNGAQCAQAPIQANYPAFNWAWSLSSYGGVYKFYTTDLGNGYARWRIFSPSSQCIRFDQPYAAAVPQTSIAGLTTIQGNGNYITITTYTCGLWGNCTNSTSNPIYLHNGSVSGTVNFSTYSWSTGYTTYLLTEMAGSGNQLIFYGSAYGSTPWQQLGSLTFSGTVSGTASVPITSCLWYCTGTNPTISSVSSPSLFSNALNFYYQDDYGNNQNAGSISFSGVQFYTSEDGRVPAWTGVTGSYANQLFNLYTYMGSYSQLWNNSNVGSGISGCPPYAWFSGSCVNYSVLNTYVIWGQTYLPTCGWGGSCSSGYISNYSPTTNTWLNFYKNF